MAKVFSPKFKAAALALLDAGVSTPAAQAQLKRRFREHVGEGTLRKWKKERDAQAADAVAEESGAPPPAPEPDVPPPAAPVAAVPEIDTYERVTRQRARVQQLADEAAQVGNMTAAQRFSKQAVDLDLLIARLDKERKTDTDTVTFTRTEIERARQSMRDRVAALAADLDRTGGIVCSHCGRKVRIALAKGE